MSFTRVSTERVWERETNLVFIRRKPLSLLFLRLRPTVSFRQQRCNKMSELVTRINTDTRLMHFSPKTNSTEDLRFESQLRSFDTTPLFLCSSAFLALFSFVVSALSLAATSLTKSSSSEGISNSSPSSTCRSSRLRKPALFSFSPTAARGCFRLPPSSFSAFSLLFVPVIWRWVWRCRVLPLLFVKRSYFEFSVQQLFSNHALSLISLFLYTFVLVFYWLKNRDVSTFVALPLDQLFCTRSIASDLRRAQIASVTTISYIFILRIKSGPLV